MQAKVTVCQAAQHRPQEKDTGPALSSACTMCGGWDPFPRLFLAAGGSLGTPEGATGSISGKGSRNPYEPSSQLQGKGSFEEGPGFFQLPIFSTS